MGQLQKVSWRAAGYAALGTAVAAASVIAVIKGDGVRPTALTSSAASRWLVDQVNQRVVLVDGLAGTVVAMIEIDSEAGDEVAVQGAGGAFFVAPTSGSVRTISTSKLQLGTAQPVALLTESNVLFGVGTSGLTVVSPDTAEARVVAVDDVTREITIPEADEALIAADGSMWLLSQTEATHVNIDESTKSVPLRSRTVGATTVGAKAVSYDATNRVVRWLDGGDVSVDSIANASQAVLQEPGDDAPCVWLGVDETLACVGATGIDRILEVDGMSISLGDRLAVAGNSAVVVDDNNQVDRIDLETQRLGTEPRPTTPASPELSITAAGNLIWLDDLAGEFAWVVHRFGINTIPKNDTRAPLLDAQGQVVESGDATGGGPATGGGQDPGEDEPDQLDNNGVDDPPVAIDDSVTARAGNPITIPVLGNDYDPDGDAIAVLRVGIADSPGHGETNVLNGTSVAYRPEPGFSGTDNFTYTIVDEHGGEDTATVTVELFPPDSPNRPPIARQDRVKTKIGRPVTIDVLANDIDPERDMLTVSTFQVVGDAKITNTVGPTGLQALKYEPPPDRPGIYNFTYQAADPQGGTSEKTKVIVEVSAKDADNEPPEAVPDATRLAVGVVGKLDVKANDTDPDGDDLIISSPTAQLGVKVSVRSQLLNITLEPGAPDLSVVRYTLSDGDPLHQTIGKVLVLKVDAENSPPVANTDAERVVIGNSVLIRVTANDVDPDQDEIRVLTASQPDDGAGTTVVEGNSVRFTPSLPDITEPTPVTFSYRISDGHGNEAVGQVTVTVLVEAVPQAPFARDDFADTVTDKSVNIDVLANDSDPSGGRPSLIGSPVCPGGGSASPTPDSRISFNPPAGLTGTYRCKYSVANTQGLRAEASIIVTVTLAPPGNSAPVIDPAKTQQTVNIGRSLTLNANDLATDDDGDSLVFSSVSKPAHGGTSFTQKAATFTYNAPLLGSADKTPEADSLDVTISDENDGNVRGTISIKIIDDTPPPKTPPTVREILRPASVGDIVAIDIVAELRDQNSTTQLTLTAASLDSGPGTVSSQGNVVSIATTGPGTVVASYTVTTSDGEPASSKIRITVTQPPPANPPVAADDVLTIPSGGSNSVDLLINDDGITDPGDVVSTTLVNRPPTSFGTVELLRGVLTFVAAPDAAGIAVIRYTLSDGSGQSSTATVTLNVLPCSESPPQSPAATLFTPYQTPVNIDLAQYVLSGSIRTGTVVGAGLTGTSGIYTPPAGMNGTEVVTFTVENGCQQTVQGQLTIDVNRAPVAGSIERAMSRGSSLTIRVEELASDDEALKILALTGNPAWINLDTSGQLGSIDGTILAAPPSTTSSGAYDFTATVQDTGGLTAAANIRVTISNLTPTAIADEYNTPDSLLTFDPTLNDIDPEDAPLSIQTIAVVNGPATIQGTPVGTIVTVALGHGISTLSYTIRDDGGLTSSSTITITSNRPPTLQPAFENTNGQPTVDIPLVINEPDGDDIVPGPNDCSAPAGFTVVLVADPGGGPPDPFNPRWELEITVAPGFNDFPQNLAFLRCTVTDEFGGRSAEVFVTIGVE